MNEKMRKALGFLGLVEDDYNEYAQSEAARPFTEEVREEPTWAPRQQSAPARPSAPSPRINPTPAPRTGAPAPCAPRRTARPLPAPPGGGLGAAAPCPLQAPGSKPQAAENPCPRHQRFLPSSAPRDLKRKRRKRLNIRI